jgi:hypothetical protein
MTFRMACKILVVLLLVCITFGVAQFLFADFNHSTFVGEDALSIIALAGIALAWAYYINKFMKSTKLFKSEEKKDA